MDQKYFKYLELLQKKDVREILPEFIRYISEEADLQIVGDDNSTADDTLLSNGNYLRISDTVSDSRGMFFKWWTDQFRRKYEQNYDSLTGLHTRTYWEDSLKKSLGSPADWTVVLADIDHFKHFNDEYGHQMGDEVLANVGRLVQEFFENDEVVIRYGGEEILILIPAELENPVKYVDRFRRELSQSTLFTDQPEQITVSVGIAFGDSSDTTFDDPIGRADVALYESKAQGRNQVTQYASYFQNKDRKWIWGFYRYIRRTNRTLAVGDDNDLVFALNQNLYKYQWNRDNSVKIEISSRVKWPFRQVCIADGKIYLLDADGCIWQINQTNVIRINSDDDPYCVRLCGNGSNLKAVGIDNIIYSIDGNSMSSYENLPEKWDYVGWGDYTYIIRHKQLHRLENGHPSDRWELPKSPVQLTAVANEVFILDNDGGIFRLNPELRRWRQLTFTEFMGNSVNCTYVSISHDMMALIDDLGRLFLVSDDSKSVPQTMNLQNAKNCE